MESREMFEGEIGREPPLTGQSGSDFVTLERDLPRPEQQACQARDRREVFKELMDCRRPRSEHEHEAARVISRLMDALKSCADDLEICIEQEYMPLQGYPSYGRKRYRDLDPVREARELLDLYKQTY